MTQYLRFTAAILFVCVIQSFTADAQMKSCCEPGTTRLESTIKQSKGTLRMIEILDSINNHANPEDFFVMNTQRAELFRKKLEIEKDPTKRLGLYFQYATEKLNAGENDEAINVYRQLINGMGITPENLNEQYKPLYDQLAIAYMRKGELENCAGHHTPQSCIIPIQGGGIHTLTSGSQQAIEIYKAILNKFPDDIQARYLLNIAYMTLGKYPDEVPKQWLIESGVFKQNPSTGIILKDIAGAKGVDMNGISGGCIVDDFDNDGLPDIMATSYGLNDQIRYMHQQKDGTIKIETASCGLAGITGGLNIIQADYNNDGLVDFVILRGGWWGKNAKFPFSLIRNKGNNTFEDVTLETGTYSPAPTQTATWADFNNDGWLDLFVAHENYPCQLFLNEKGKFRDVAPQYGLNITTYAKSCIWGDINNDGWPDLYIATLGSPNKLFLNKAGAKPGERVFEDISKTAGVEQPMYSFPSWFFDFDNDGWQDLYVSGYDTRRFAQVGGDAARDMLGMPPLGELPRLYHNNHDNTFTDVTAEYGLNHVNYTMGCNFGDIDNDGWPDFYLGTGAPDYTTIVPNKLYHNIEGKRFEDITYATNTGHIQKGHGVAFADFDNDGDQDIYEVIGGAVEGDRFRNVLFENTSPTGNHWIQMKLEGTSSNRSAIGARIRIRTKMPDGSSRDFFHVLSSGGSFGANPLRLEAGLGKAVSIEEVEIQWPNAKHSTEIIKDLQLDTRVKIKEGMGKQ